MTAFGTDAEEAPPLSAKNNPNWKVVEYRRKVKAGSKLFLHSMEKRKIACRVNKSLAVPLTPAEQFTYEKSVACQRNSARKRRTRERVAKGRGETNGLLIRHLLSTVQYDF